MLAEDAVICNFRHASEHSLSLSLSQYVWGGTVSITMDKLRNAVFLCFILKILPKDLPF